MTNEEYVRLFYPDAVCTLDESSFSEPEDLPYEIGEEDFWIPEIIYIIYNHPKNLNRFPLGVIGTGKTEKDAWEYAVRYCNLDMLHTLEE